MIKPLLLLCICFLVFFLKGLALTCEGKDLVFEETGIRGIAYAGVIEVLEKQGRCWKT